MKRLCFAIICVVALSGPLRAQTWDEWLTARTPAAVDRAVGRTQMGINGKSGSKQQNSPSSNDRSTSLVDQSSATDFVSTALSLVPLGTSLQPQGSQGSPASPPGSATSTGTGSGTVTASVYSLLAALSKESLTNPDFYAKHTGARNMSITVGTVVSDKPTDNTDKPGTVLGFKWTPINQRDLYSKTGKKAIQDVRDALRNEANSFPGLLQKVQQLIFLSCAPDGVCRNIRQDVLDIPSDKISAFGEFVAKYQGKVSTIQFSKAVLDQIDDLVRVGLAPSLNYQETVNRAYDNIHGGRQFALSYQVIKRVANGNDNHRAELIYDNGITDSITWTVNGSADYIDRKLAKSSIGGRLATEFKGRLTSDSGDPFGKGPIWLSFSGEAKWLTKTRPQYSFQASLTVPIQTGVDFPIVYRWANRQDLIDQTRSEVRMGLNVDLGRLTQLFRP